MPSCGESSPARPDTSSTARKATVEPVFAQNKFNRGFRRFQRLVGRTASLADSIQRHAELRLSSPSLCPTATATSEARRVVVRRVPRLIGLTSLLFSARRYAEAGGAGPIRRPALTASEGGRRRQRTAGAALGFASCAHLLLAGQRNLPAKGAPARPRARALGQAPARDRQSVLLRPKRRARRTPSRLCMGARAEAAAPTASRATARATHTRIPAASVVCNLFGTWAAARAAASGEDLGAARTGGPELVELIGHTGDSCAQSTEIARKIRQSEGVRRQA